MPDAVARYQKDALTGHRPTWKMGANTSAKGKTGAAEEFDGAADPFHVFSELNGRGRWRPGPGAQAKAETRKVMNAERKALQVRALLPARRWKSSRRSTRRWSSSTTPTPMAATAPPRIA